MLAATVAGADFILTTRGQSDHRSLEFGISSSNYQVGDDFSGHCREGAVAGSLYTKASIVSLPGRPARRPMKQFPLLGFAAVSAWLFLCTRTLLAGSLTGPVQETIAAFCRTDSTITNHFGAAKGYVVFPEITKGGLVFGGAHGDGHVFEAGRLVGGAELTQVTVGAQIGGQVYSEVIFFATEAALADFKASRFKMSAQVSAVVAAEGVSQHAKYHEGVAIFTLPKQGLMGEASVGGQKFKFKPHADKP